MNRPHDIVVDIDDRQADRELDAAHLAGVLASSLAASGVVGPAEVGLAFISAEEMSTLNSDHMGKPGPTDVLAFPIDGRDPAAPGQPSMVGDIVICPVVADQAPQSLADELALLVVHGALHLVGHDHAEAGERQIMQTHERNLLAALHASAGGAA